MSPGSKEHLPLTFRLVHAGCQHRHLSPSELSLHPSLPPAQGAGTLSQMALLCGGHVGPVREERTPSGDYSAKAYSRERENDISFDIRHSGQGACSDASRTWGSLIHCTVPVSYTFWKRHVV